MVASFEGEQKLELTERLLTALEAGYAASGDRRGTRAAELWVAGNDFPFGGFYLRVQEQATPLIELRRLLALGRQETDLAATIRRTGQILLPLVTRRTSSVAWAI